MNHVNGSLAVVSNKANTAVLGTFLIGSLAAAANGNCSLSPTTLRHKEPQVLWDGDAARWIFTEMVNNTVTKVSTFCVYVSSTSGSNPLNATYTGFSYQPWTNTSNGKIGLWSPGAYGVTFTLEAGALLSNVCVLDRQALLFPTLLNTSFTNTTTNVTILASQLVPPTLFCAGVNDGLLPGVPASEQQWMPVSLAGPPFPTVAAQNSNSPLGASSIGALFVRAVDDEYHYGAASPTVDQIFVEHWYNINFTAATYATIRYPIQVTDFDQSGGSGGDVCISTPVSGVRLQGNPFGLTARASFRRRPLNEQESIVTALTSYGRCGNGTNATLSRIYWFELRWAKPDPGTAERWTLYQQGTVNGTGTASAFLPSITMDANGTIAMAYAVSSNITYPSVYVTSRLANDIPLGGMRTPSLLVAAGDAGSIFNNGTDWGRSFAITPDGSSRTFFLAGQTSSISSGGWHAKTARVRVLAETIQRTWSATDACGTRVQCVQIINTQ
jgi:hypothetical protein